jgi:hypothetical protein
MSPQEYWYPVFKLVKNPFRLFEAGMEEYEDIPFLDVPMKRKVETLVKVRQSCIVKGPRGCGKSTVIQIVEVKDEEIFRVVTPKSVDDACNQIFRQFDDELTEEIAERLWNHFVIDAIEGSNNCKLCRIHCYVPIRREPTFEFLVFLRSLDVFCFAKRKLFKELTESAVSVSFLIDVPDNLAGKEVKNFASLCNRLLSDPSNTVIIFATPEQASVLKAMDTFARFPVVNFELLDKTFFRELFKARVEAFREGDAPLPFKEEVIDKLAEISGFNPRIFIQLSSSVLTQMWLEGLKEPCGLDFLDKLDIIDAEKGVSEKDKIIQVLVPFKGKWIKLEELCRGLRGNLGIEFSERKASQYLSDLGFSLRRVRDGKTEVFITPSTLDGLQKTKSWKSTMSTMSS